MTTPVEVEAMFDEAQPLAERAVWASAGNRPPPEVIDELDRHIHRIADATGRDINDVAWEMTKRGIAGDHYRPS